MNRMEWAQLPLFVYGTLMSGERAYGRFSHAVERSAPATLAETVLYSLGPYPMAAPGDGIVIGEVHWLASAAHDRVLVQLDEYEGVGVLGYARVPVTVQVTVDGTMNDTEYADEGQVRAWVYLGLARIAERGLKIESGDWRTHRTGRDE